MDGYNKVTIHYRAALGFQMTNPISYVVVIFPESRKLTWAEKRRNELMWKIQVRKAVFNMILFWICYLVAIALTTAGGIGIIILLQPPKGLNVLMGIGMGYLLSQIWLILWLIMFEWFKTDPSDIKLKR